MSCLQIPDHVTNQFGGSFITVQLEDVKNSLLEGVVEIETTLSHWKIVRFTVLKKMRVITTLNTVLHIYLHLYVVLLHGHCK